MLIKYIMKEYKIKFEPVIIQGITYPKYNIYYYIDGVLENIEAFYGDVIEGYTFIDSNIDDTDEVYLAMITPKEVALWKLRAVLNSMGLEESITTAIDTLPTEMKIGATYIWNYGNSIDRNSNTILFIQNALSLTTTQVNQIFITANNIRL